MKVTAAATRLSVVLNPTLSKTEAVQCNTDMLDPMQLEMVAAQAATDTYNMPIYTAVNCNSLRD